MAPTSSATQDHGQGLFPFDPDVLSEEAPVADLQMITKEEAYLAFGKQVRCALTNH